MIPGPHRLSRRVNNYIKYRPGYPQAVIEQLKKDCQLAATHVIADIGSGTGLLSELFLGNGNRVFGIEPDPDMRAGGEYYLREYPNFTSIAATAEETTLLDQSIDFVTAGQAFHWFDPERARREFLRVLVPGGWVVLVWNVQKAEGTPFLEALQRFWADTRYWKRSESRPLDLLQQVQKYRLNPDLVRREVLEPFYVGGQFKEKVFQNPLVCDLEALKGRVLSNGPALEPGDPLYEPMLAALEEIFWAYQEDGTVTIDHDTRLVYGQLVPRHDQSF